MASRMKTFAVMGVFEDPVYKGDSYCALLLAKTALEAMLKVANKLQPNQPQLLIVGAVQLTGKDYGNFTAPREPSGRAASVQDLQEGLE